MRMFDRVVALVTGRRTAWAMAVLPLLLAGLFIGLVGEAENEPGVTDGLPRGARVPMNASSEEFFQIERITHCS